MHTRILHCCLFLLAVTGVVGCSKEESEKTNPTSPLVGRWDFKSQQSTFYNMEGGVIWDKTNVGDAGDYNIYTADKHFEVYDNNVLISSGTYTYENNTLTLVGTKATTTYATTLYSPTHLILTADARTGKAGVLYKSDYEKR